MLKRVILMSICIGLSATVYVSCSKNENVDLTKSNDNDNLKPLTETTIDPQIVQAVENRIYQLGLDDDITTSMTIEEDLQDLVYVNFISDMHDKTMILRSEFTEAEIMYSLGELKTLAGGSASGNCCARNPDGTLNKSCCNFWEAALVILRSSFSCDDGKGDMRPRTLQEKNQLAQDYLNCMQDIICETC